MLRVLSVICVLAVIGITMSAVVLGFDDTPESDKTADDLNPVTFRDAPRHPPVPIVADGAARATICVVGARSRRLNEAVGYLQSFVEKATGATLPIVYNEIKPPAIVVGDCELARQHGLDPAKMPVEGFAIKTAADHVFIVGRDEDIVAPTIRSDGTAFGVLEFLERFVGVRWYFPGELGQSAPAAKSLSVPAVWLEDSPVFRMRVMWPPMANPNNGTGTPLHPVQDFLRAGNSWATQLKVHQPNWATVEEYRTQRPEVFQLRSDGTRDHFMLCYSNPLTLKTYLENAERHFAGQKPVHLGIFGDAITVSPNDAEIACYCDDCRKLWDADGGQYGSASRIVAKFTAELAGEVQQRWPGKQVIYLPYLNYTAAPADMKFPDNVEIQLCGMPGLAQYKEPVIAADEQRNIDRWFTASGRKIQNWHYSCWPANRTTAVYQYPHAIQEFYRANREKTVGTFINGETDHWIRHHVSLYCWLKLLWDPEFNVDAAIDEYCRRMYGPAAESVRDLVRLETEGWEQERWPGGRLSPKAIHEASFPRERVEQMRQLLAQAREQAAGDELVTKRLDYIAAPLEEFFKESRDYHSGSGLKPLLVQKVGENPVIDGKLDDAVWKRSEPVAFVRGWDKVQTEPTYATQARAVWTNDGVTFGFHMHEPTPDRLERKIQGHDDSMAWWDDNIELLFDVTGKNEGEFYHFILNPNAAVADAKGSDFSWNIAGMKTKAHAGENFWSLEVFFPYTAFPEAVRPGTAADLAWTGNFTRHRVADRGLKQTLKRRQGSEREYQRMNTTYAKPSNNLQDFAPLKFVE